MIKKKDRNIEDKKIWQDYIKNPSDIYDKEKNLPINNTRRDRFKFDLHCFTLDEANKKVKAIILSCVKEKYKEILLITGKGLHSTIDNNAYVSKDLSKLKFSVPEFINNNNELGVHVLSVSEANIKDGGAGAILVRLKNL